MSATMISAKTNFTAILSIADRRRRTCRFGIGAALAGDNVTEDQIVRALAPAEEAADPRPVGRPAGRPGRRPRRKPSSSSTIRGRTTRSLSNTEREEIATIAKDKPNIDLEITFDYNSADISAKSMPSVQALGRALTSPDLKGSTFVVAGHTDAAGGDAYNQDLSERRADSIKRYLIDKVRHRRRRPRDRRLRQEQAEGSEPADGGSEPPRAGREHGKQDHRVEVSVQVNDQVVRQLQVGSRGQSCSEEASRPVAGRASSCAVRSVRFHATMAAPRPSSSAIQWIDPAMTLSEYLKPALGARVLRRARGGYYWWEHRPEPEEKDTPGQALVVVTKSTNACFSDLVRVTGFVVPRREAVVGADQEGSKVTDLFVREGDMVTDNQELARLSAPPQQPGAPAGAAEPAPVSLRAPAAGLVTEVRTIVGAPASPQAGPMFRIAVNNEIELDAEVPSVHLPKLNPGATARISRDNAPDLIGRVRLVSPQIDRTTQLGHVRIALDQQSVAEGRHVRPRQYRRQAQLRRRGSAHRHRPSHRSGGQRQHGRDAQGPGRAGVRHLDRNPGRPRRRRNRRGRRRHFAA